ncbi:MAG: restriction endonuclease subunit S, partial [Treponema sp.]|nr:restriction endonuclease subunit S [Treponema sp.]
MTAKDLKNALLQEAVQGKLVPQIASEGNARDLLEEIRKERGESLPLASARKRASATPSAGSNAARNARFAPITEDEIPFEIPENWCWCRIGEIFNLQAGKTISSSEISETSNGNDYLCYGGNGIRGYVKNYNKEGYYPLIGRQGALCGNINFANGKFYATEHAVVVETYADTNIEWAGLFLKALNLNQYATATAQPGLAVRNINEVLIPLPPLAEQKRIVDAIEKFMPLIEEYGKKETELKAFNEQIGMLTKKAILQEAVQGKLVPQIAAEGNAKDLLEEIRKERLSHGLDFANAKSGKRKSKKETALAGSNPCDISDDEIPFDIPESWCWCRLSELCNLYTGDSINETEKKLKYTNIKEGWFYIGTKDVNFDQTINYDNGIKIPFEKDNFRIAPKNTVLMCIEGGSAGRKIAFTNQDVCFGNKLCCFNSYKNEIEKFIFYF